MSYPTPVTNDNVHEFFTQVLPNGAVLADRLCFLVTANSGFNVGGWGFLSFGPGGHQIGLHEEEAIELIGYKNFLGGLDAAGIDVFKAFHRYFDPYIAKIKAAQDAADAELAKSTPNSQPNSPQAL